MGLSYLLQRLGLVLVQRNKCPVAVRQGGAGATPLGLDIDHLLGIGQVRFVREHSRDVPRVFAFRELSLLLPLPRDEHGDEAAENDARDDVEDDKSCRSRLGRTAAAAAAGVVGALVGAGTGAGVGFGVGAKTGAAVGTGIGFAVGAIDTVGFGVGAGTGASDGAGVGLAVGAALTSPPAASKGTEMGPLTRPRPPLENSTAVPAPDSASVYAPSARQNWTASSAPLSSVPVSTVALSEEMV